MHTVEFVKRRVNVRRSSDREDSVEQLLRAAFSV